MRASFFALLGLAAGGCFGGSTVVAPDARFVSEPSSEPEWRPANASDLHGLFESRRIEGEAAASLWRLTYWFAPDGSYTGAALVFDGERASFQTLAGEWTLAGDELDLHAGAPARASVAGELLRLRNEAGVAIFERVELE